MGTDYTSLPLPQLLTFIQGLGNPSTIDTSLQNWDGLAAELVKRVGNPFGPDAATLNGFFAAISPHWKGAGADAFGQQVNDLSNYGMEVAARANLNNPGFAPAADYPTFHNSLDTASTVLTYVKQEAAKLHPQPPIDFQTATSLWYNSLPVAQRPIRWGNGLTPAIQRYRADYNLKVVDQNNTNMRTYALQLLAALDGSYTSAAAGLPTKAPGNPPALHDSSNGGAPWGSSYPSGYTPQSSSSTPTFSTGTLPGHGGQLPTGQLPTGQLPTGQLPTASQLHGSSPGLPVGVTPVVSTAGLHPLASTSVPGLSANGQPTLLNPNTQLAAYTPPGVLPASSAGSGLLPLNSLPAGALPGLSTGSGSLPFSSVPGSFAGGVAALPSDVAAASLAATPFSALGLGRTPGIGTGSPRGANALGDTAGFGDPMGLAATAGLSGNAARGSGLAGVDAADAANGATAAERAAAAEAAGLTGGGEGMPMMPYMPMSPMGAQGSDGRSRRTWLDEDEDVWKDDSNLLPPPVIGRAP